MLETVSGIFHLHTGYSYDSSASLKEITILAKKKGYRFLLLTEHSDDFNDEKMKKFVAECECLSTEDLIVIPGLEVNCDFGRHILAVGIKEFIGVADPDDVIDRIRGNGGLAIIPHPVLCQFRSFVTLTNRLNGVEVWNSRYDGKYAPSLKSFRLLSMLQKENPKVFAYGGLDLHSIQDFDDLCLKVELAMVTEQEVLQCLKKGNFKVARKKIVIDSSGDITRMQRLFFDMVTSVTMVGRTVCSSLREAQ